LLARPVAFGSNARIVVRFSLRAHRRLPLLIRGAFWLGSTGLAAWLVTVSWMRWMDPFIDFGREIYIPWRILSGEHPGRDFIHPYGPLSVYFNAGLFAVFGVSIRTLVVANLAIFAVIVVGLFTLVRRSFGFLPAAVATLVCIAVFGFPHYWGVNNYTYAAPYSHEATHGMLLLIALLVWLGRPRFMGDARDGLVAGGLCGLGCLTKTEYVVVAAALWVLATVRVARAGQRLGPWWAGGCAGYAAIFASAWLLLSSVVGPVVALKSATNAVTAPFRFRAYSTSTHVLHFLGADHPLENFQTIARWSGSTIGVFAALVILALVAGRTRQRTVVVGCAALGLGLAGWVAWRVDWVFCGSAFPILLVIGATLLGRNLWKFGIGPARPGGGRRWNELLHFVAAIGLLARMAFDPTISHYGFFQAMLAGTWLCGFLLGEFPALGRSATAQAMLRGWLAAVIGIGAVTLVLRSLQFYAVKQTSMGEGGDGILGFDPKVYPLPEMWERIRQHIANTTAASASVLVIPEGLTINYWTRRKHPLPVTDLLPATLALANPPVTEALMTSPPDVVVLVSRNMGEFGFASYGQDDETRRLLEWVSSRYAVERTEGGQPFAPPNLGVWVLRLKSQ